MTLETIAVINEEAQDPSDTKRVFEIAAELFGALSSPVRLKVLNMLCDGECSVSELLAKIDTTQPNLSQHLNLMYRSGILSRTKVGTQVIYKISSKTAAGLCRSVCTQIAIDLDEPAAPAKFR
jgi:DNA-binding transcriptional ArsR family regulator